MCRWHSFYASISPQGPRRAWPLHAAPLPTQVALEPLPEQGSVQVEPA